MKIHVTGSKGFIAGHLIAELLDRGHEVTGSDRELAWEPESFLRSCDLCVHAGAVVGRVRGSAPDAVSWNAGSTNLLAETAAKLGRRVLYISTSEVYGNAGGTAHESHALGRLPHNLYGLTKRWGEETLRLHLPPELLTVARLSMPYGPGHPPGEGRAALTNFLWCAMHGDPLVVHRDSRRSWCWVGDTVSALALLADLQRTGAGVWNIGRDDNELSMLEVAQLAILLTDSRSELDIVNPPSNQTLVKRLSTEKIRRLGWAPEVELEEGARRTLRWLEGWRSLNES